MKKLVSTVQLIVKVCWSSFRQVLLMMRHYFRGKILVKIIVVKFCISGLAFGASIREFRSLFTSQKQDLHYVHGLWYLGLNSPRVVARGRPVSEFR